MKIPQTTVSLTETEYQALHRVHDILVQDISKRYTNATLSRLVGLNHQKMNMGFKTLFGYSVFVFAQITRMQEAWHLLREAGLPTKQVATMVGFSNADNFITAFRRYFNQTPARCRTETPSDHFGNEGYMYQ